MSAAESKPKGMFGRLFGGRKDPAPDAPPPEQDENVASSEAVPAGQEATPIAEVPAPSPEPEVAETPAPPVAAEPPARASWFQRLKAGLSKTSSRLTDGITGLVSKRKLDGATLDELEDLLIGADLGLDTAQRITTAISKGRFEKGLSSEDVRGILSTEITKVLQPVAAPLVIDAAKKPHVVVVLGVNGSGKTTTIGKLAAQLSREGKKVMLGAGDTFRAAAIDQLKVWGERTGAPVVSRDVGSDASGLAFDALKDARDGGYDVLLLDTAGRLQNKEGLMAELEKIVRVLKKVDATAPHDVVLVLDATTGQNALNQVDVFRERAGVTGLIMTKLDGTARGGILVAIAAKFGLPVHAIGVGEGIDDLQPFSADDFARAIAES